MATAVASMNGHDRTGTARARIGAVRYLNTVPLIQGLERLGDVSVRVGPPSDLIGMLERDEVDVALASIVDCQLAETDVTLLPEGMIGCDGETLTVRVLSRVPMERINTIHADTESHTSVVLAQVVIGWTAGAPPRVTPWDARAPGPWPESVVVIGDKVMDDRVTGYPHSIDLGEAWKARTGLPFVYAAWMCRADRVGTEPVRLARTILDRQRRHNAMRTDWIVAHQAAAHGWPADDARRYLRDLLRFDVTDAHTSAISRFFDQARAMGVLELRRPVRWAGTP